MRKKDNRSRGKKIHKSKSLFAVEYFIQFKTKQRNRNKQSELQNQLNDN